VKRSVYWLASLLLLPSCSDPLKDAQLVVEPRVLGARVEVEGEPERASPAPGEAASVRWLVVAPEPDPLLGWSLGVCSAAPEGSGLPACAEAPFAVASADEPVAGEPRLDFVVPAETTATALAVLGSVCPGSAPDGAGGCSEPGGTAVSFDFALAPGELNFNPSIEPEALSFDGAVWQAGSDCALVPSVAPSSGHAIALLLDEGDREPITPETSADPDREVLQASHFATGGELQRAFTIIQADQSDLGVSLEWKAPAAAPEGGLIRFFFVVRDARGGSDWLERALCVTP
jgi:hypothetical protein